MWVAISFSRGSSPPRDWTWVSCIAGIFFTNWATREALSCIHILFYNCQFPHTSFVLITLTLCDGGNLFYRLETVDYKFLQSRHPPVLCTTGSAWPATLCVLNAESMTKQGNRGWLAQGPTVDLCDLFVLTSCSASSAWTHSVMRNSLPFQAAVMYSFTSFYTSIFVCSCFDLICCWHSSLLSSLPLRLILLVSVMVTALLATGTWLPWAESLIASIPLSMVRSPRSGTFAPMQTQPRFSIITHKLEDERESCFLFPVISSFGTPCILVAVLGLMYQEAAWERSQTQGDECSEREHYDTVRVLNVLFPKLTPPLGLSNVWANKYPVFIFSFFYLKAKELWLIRHPIP